MDCENFSASVHLCLKRVVQRIERLHTNKISPHLLKMVGKGVTIQFN